MTPNETGAAVPWQTSRVLPRFWRETAAPSAPPRAPRPGGEQRPPGAPRGGSAKASRAPGLVLPLLPRPPPTVGSGLMCAPSPRVVFPVNPL